MSINVCNDRSMASITSLPSGVSGSSLVLISEQTASSSSTISFTSGIDSTYKEYIFKFINIHPSATESFRFQASTDGGSNYNTAVTNTYFHAQHDESSTSPTLTYDTGNDQAQGTGFIRLNQGIDHDNADENGSGFLHLFDPSNTTFVKHYIARNVDMANNYMQDAHAAGYFNTTSAINAIQFKMNSGNIDSGTIKMYGVV